MSGWADTEEDAASAFVEIVHVLCDVIQVDMCADLAYDKATVVAAAPGDRRSDRLAGSVRRSLRDAGGGDVVAAHKLGIDFAAGCPHAAWATKPGANWRKRFAKGRKRAGRAATIKNHLSIGSKHKAKRLFAGKIRAVAYYGPEVHGLDEKELAAAWRLVAKCLSPSTPGKSVEALALTNIGAFGPLPFAQARRWAAEVWKAAYGTDRMAITLAELISTAFIGGG